MLIYYLVNLQDSIPCAIVCYAMQNFMLLVVLTCILCWIVAVDMLDLLHICLSITFSLYLYWTFN